jgi:hypothetical protein
MKTTKIELNETNYLSVAKRLQELFNYNEKRKEIEKIKLEKEEVSNFKTKFYLVVQNNIDLEFLFSLGYYTGLKA